MKAFGAKSKLCISSDHGRITETDPMTERGAFFDLATSTPVAFETVIAAADQAGLFIVGVR